MGTTFQGTQISTMIGEFTYFEVSWLQKKARSDKPEKQYQCLSVKAAILL
jgi:hypothetical protein